MSMADLAASAGHRAVAPQNPVLLLLLAVAAASALGGGFVSLAPNRLVSGRPIAFGTAVGASLTVALAICAATILLVAFVRPRRWVHYLSASVAGAALLIVLAAAGSAAAVIGIGAPGLARVSLGAGFWMLLGCSALALIDALRRAGAGAPIQLVVVAIVVVGFVAMERAGIFDALSLAQEYQLRRDTLAADLLRHAELVGAAVVPAVLIGAPLALTALRRPRFEAPLFAVLNLLQTIPSIALFGLLLVPLSALAGAMPALGAIGIGGVGPAPAIIALVLYALLPIARNTLAGVAGVSPSAIDAARGMGMTRRQVFWQVQIPLASPVLVAGLRIVIVQAIGLAVVAALIGAGGLGTLVFQGLGQYAADLVLLGALPAIGLALAADFLLRLVAEVLRRRYAP
jgi:osmoprotectant transport system permease protein